MVELEPVRAWHPNPSNISANQLVCPVYDTVTIDDYDRFAAKRYNAVRFVSRREGSSSEEFVEEAKAQLERALAAQAYVQDSSRALYVYGIGYTPPTDLAETFPVAARRSEYLLLGVVGTLPLGSKERSDVAPHERTFADRVDERIRLTDATGMHFAPILAGYRMPDHRLNDTLERILGLDRRKLSFRAKRAPVVKAAFDGTTHRLWRVEDPQEIREIQELLGRVRLLILDGHHRYAAANARRHAGKPSAPLLMAVEYGDRALILRPWHRVLSSNLVSWPRFESAARSYFAETRPVPEGLSVEGLVHEVNDFPVESRRGCIAVGASGGLRLSNPRTAREDDFDVVHAFLEKELGIRAEQPTFVRSPRRALERLGSSAAATSGIAVLMPSIDPVAVEERAFRDRQVMVQKSTMFLPKVADGIIFAAASG